MGRGTKRPKAVLPALAALVIGVASAGTSARADFLFSPTGAGGTVYDVLAIDPSVGNALAKGGVTAINAGVGSTFQLYYQASVGALVGPSGNFTPPGLGTPGSPNSTYELTVVGSITEQVTSVSAATGQATFAVAAAQSPDSFLRIFNGTGATFNANALAGTGYNDGTLILAGTPIPTTLSPGTGGNFTSRGGSTLFDQFGADDYGGKQSVSGFGDSVVDFNVTFRNPDFFPSGGSAVVGLRFNTSTSAPFQGINPSMVFAGLGPGGTDVTPNVGAINGTTGPDFQFQADAFVTAVPEPSSLLLTALGVVGLVGYGRTRKRPA
jgi:hypothetical protein